MRLIAGALLATVHSHGYRLLVAAKPIGTPARRYNPVRLRVRIALRAASAGASAAEIVALTGRSPKVLRLALAECRNGMECATLAVALAWAERSETMVADSSAR